MKHFIPLSKAIKALSFYKWAFGDLTEQDTDVGLLAEYLVGEMLGCLPPSRKVIAPFDLVMKSGTTIEVKCTTHKRAKKGSAPVYRWDVSTQGECIKGNRQIADLWIFLITSFPGKASRVPSIAQAFDLDNWTAYLVTGEDVRKAGCKQYVSESTLKRIGAEAFPMKELRKRFGELTD